MEKIIPILVYSEDDIAGKNITKILREEGMKVHEIKGELIYAERIDEELRKIEEFNFIIFLSRHKSAEKRKTLTVHTIGNWKEAKYGGEEGKVSPANAIINKEALIILKEEAEKAGIVGDGIKGYEVVMETTHHGPLINTPSFFIETGGSAEEWNDEKAIKVIAETVKELLRRINNDEINYDKESIIAVGGPHYCPVFSKRQLTSEYAIGHLIPSYALPINKEMIHEAINKTIPKPKKVLIEYKGLGRAEQRDETIKLLKEEGIEVIRSEMKKEA